MYRNLLNGRSYNFENWLREIISLVQDSETILQKGIHAMLFSPKEKGQGLVEYAIILALVALVVIAVMRILGPKIGNTFSSINKSMDTF